MCSTQRPLGIPASGSPVSKSIPYKIKIGITLHLATKTLEVILKYNKIKFSFTLKTQKYYKLGGYILLVL